MLCSVNPCTTCVSTSIWYLFLAASTHHCTVKCACSNSSSRTGNSLAVTCVAQDCSSSFVCWRRTLVSQVRCRGLSFRAGEQQRARRRCHVQDSQHARSGGGARHERRAPGMFEESNALAWQLSSAQLSWCPHPLNQPFFKYWS